MNLAIVTAIHGRLPITLAFLKSVKRIYDEFGVHTYIAVTPEDRAIHHLNGEHLHYIEYANKTDGKTVGDKFNAAFDLLRGTDFTHAMILGSDDIASSWFIQHAMTLDEYDISGVDALWFWGLNPRRAGFQRFGYFPIKGVIAGTGKVLSRRAVEVTDYAPWPPCNYGMDAKMMMKTRTAFRHAGEKYTSRRYSLSESGGFLLDVKFGHHISSMSPILRREVYREHDPLKVLPKHLPQDECDYLFNLWKETRDAYNASRMAEGQKPV